ncbi:hypothetical protein GIB67_026978 [Kingdonia uniflora]|uniref:Expansin n=1 Tax=Kingdonia uniflora TaxID=39325 RepID=A0A7J7P1U1_9MAGN|nr:hypothetical protein GIB67_026978 [Kingdonia uniflora]
MVCLTNCQLLYKPNQPQFTWIKTSQTMSIVSLLFFSLFLFNLSIAVYVTNMGVGRARMPHFMVVVMLLAQWVCGACGYGNLYSSGYGTDTAALNTTLFNNGELFRYHLEGKNYNYIYELLIPSHASYYHYIYLVTMLAFRVPCMKKRGLGFTINDHIYFNLVLITNVGGAGDISTVSIKGSNIGWHAMSSNWGQNWQSNSNFNGQSISFQVTTTDDRTLIVPDVAPAGWQYGQTFEGGQF